MSTVVSFGPRCTDQRESGRGGMTPPTSTPATNSAPPTGEKIRVIDVRVYTATTQVHNLTINDIPELRPR